MNQLCKKRDSSKLGPPYKPRETPHTHTQFYEKIKIRSTKMPQYEEHAACLQEHMMTCNSMRVRTRKQSKPTPQCEHEREARERICSVTVKRLVSWRRAHSAEA